MTPRQHDHERQPLLHHSDNSQFPNEQNQQDTQAVDFDHGDFRDPHTWSRWAKFANVFQVSMIAFVLPMSSSIYAPAAHDIARHFNTSSTVVLLNQTGFVCMLGLGPLFLAPMSETFGRRNIYLINVAMFVLMHIPTALAPNIETFLVFRTLSGFFGSVGVGNGGGTITDMFHVNQRAAALGFYFLFPLLAPSVGPLLGGIVIDRLQWQWITWINMILAAVVLIVAYFFLYETRAVTILQKRQQNLEKKNPATNYYVEGASKASIPSKIASNSTRAVKILVTQPIVLTLSIYQALIFSTMYSLYAQYSNIWSKPPWNFSKTETGLAYLAPAFGFSVSGILIVLYIDKVYNLMQRWHASKTGTSEEGEDEEGEESGIPEYRLPIANIGAIFLPIALFWFGWTIDKKLSAPIPLIGMVLFGAAQVCIFNPVQTYYIDAYEKNAASALAAGAFLRAFVGGIIPIFVPGWTEELGFGPVMSIFGGLAVLLMPAPLLFYWKGRQLRERFPFEG